MQNNKISWPEMKKMLVVAVFSALIGALAATFITSSLMYGRQQPQAESETRIPKVAETQESVIPVIAREVSPAVVGISTIHVEYDFFTDQLKRKR